MLAGSNPVRGTIIINVYFNCKGEFIMLSTKDVRFYSNEEKRTVVAVAEDVCFDIAEQIYGREIFSDPVLLNSIPSELLIPNRIEAKARCHPTDTWDYSVGKKVALEKLLSKYNKYKFKVLTDYAMAMHEVADHYEDIADIFLKRSKRDINPSK